MTTSTENPDAPRDVNVALIAVAGVSVVGASLAALAHVGSPFGVLAGGAVATVNLWLVATIVRAFFRPSGAKVSWGLLATLKFLVLVAGLLWLVRSGSADPLSLVLGYAALPVGIVVAQLAQRRTVTGES